MTINLLTNELSIHHLQVEWNILSEIITQFAYFEANKEDLVNKIYTDRIDDLKKELLHINSYLKEFNDDFRNVFNQLITKLPSDNSLEVSLNYLAKDGVLSFSELNKLTLLIESVFFLRNDIPCFKIEEFEKLNQMDFKNIQQKYIQKFRYLVDTNGNVHFERHPELLELNLRLKDTEERIRKLIQEWINHPSHSKLLQYNSYDIHYDRFVVPVRSDSYRSELGLIISRSESGQTLYVEPIEVREGCNKRMELIAKIDEIINQLGVKFSRLLSDFLPQLSETLKLIQQIDYYLAKSLFSNEYRLTQPEIISEPGFKFAQLFHPLIKNPVKNDVTCESRHHGIVISGPNTGGKTVFLKSITLSYLLFYHGFFVPAKEAQIYPYQGLFYFGNDLQNLQSGLSSFSGEVKNYISLLENVLASNLILIDEIFNSTSSDEASALSLAYFDELHKKSHCHIVVSTHHQMFKTLIHQEHQYISCHVGFDSFQMRPTYKIIWGTPGPSMAIDIFKLLSNNNESLQNIPQRANLLLNSKSISYETLLKKVSQKEIELDNLLNITKKMEIELKNQKGAMEGIVNLKIDDELSKARTEINKIINEAKAIVEASRRNEIQKIKKIEEKAHNLHFQVSKIGRVQESSLPTITEEGNLDIQSIRPGDLVYSLFLKKEFTVLGSDQRKNEVTIAKGTIKLSVPITSLRMAKHKNTHPKVNVSFLKTSNSHIEYDVRGMRLTEFQNLMDQALGDLLSGDIPYLSIIHGHGDGVLKNWLRDYLKKSKNFSGQTPENGNDGETKILLR
jgi:DNA mismatch repair protein MutS2